MKAWTLQELRFLRLMYPAYKAKVIGQQLGRTEASVNQAVFRFNLKGRKEEVKPDDPLYHQIREHIDAIKRELV